MATLYQDSPGPGILKQVPETGRGDSGIHGHVGGPGTAHGQGRDHFFPAAVADDGHKAAPAAAPGHEPAAKGLGSPAQILIAQAKVAVRQGQGIGGIPQGTGKKAVQRLPSRMGECPGRGVGRAAASQLFLRQQGEAVLVPDPVVGGQHPVDPDLRRLRDVVDHAPERAQGRMGAVLVAEADGAGEDDGDDVSAGTARASAPFADDLHAGEGAVIHVGPQPGLQGPCAPEEG